MRTVTRDLSLGLVALGFVTSVVANTTYESGYLWNRSQQWSGGSIPGSTAGNPDDDTKGNPVWIHATSEGGGLASSSPWYAQPYELMVWDNYWYGNGGQPVWARGYAGPESSPSQNLNVNPPITRYALTHDVSEDFYSWQYVPQIRWVNPVGDGAIVNIFTYTGHPLLVEWAGGNGKSPDLDFEFAIAKFDKSANSYDLLYSTFGSNPQPGSNNPPFPQQQISFRLNGVRFDAGDELVYSMRIVSDGPVGLNWVNLYDHPFYIRLVSVVPEPSSYAMLFGGLALLAFRLRGRRVSKS